MNPITLSWIILIIAGLFETGFATCLGMANQTQGRASYLWYGGFLLCLIISMLLLMKAVQQLPVGTAYGVWTGIGAVGTVLIGIFLFNEAVSFWRIFFLFTLIASIIGLKVVTH